jgi:hypothetical protein
MTGTARTARGAGRASIGAGTAVMGVLLAAPAGAGAQALPACDAADRAQRPALVIRGLPARIAPDREIPFRIARATRGTTRAVYAGGASVATERPQEEELLTEYFLDRADDRLLGRGMPYWLRMRAGEAPATVTLEYSQDTRSGRCRVTLSRRVRAVEPRAPRVRLEFVRGAGAVEARLAVGVAGGCHRGRAGTTTVRVSRAGRGRTIRLWDLCERWTPRAVRLPGLIVSAGGGPRRALHLRPVGGGGPYRVRVAFHGRVVLRRTVPVR